MSSAVFEAGSRELRQFFDKLVAEDRRNSKCIDCGTRISMDLEVDGQVGWGM